MINYTLVYLLAELSEWIALFILILAILRDLPFAVLVFHIESRNQLPNFTSVVTYADNVHYT